MKAIEQASESTASGSPHYVSLDSLRGVCALCVVMYHMPSTSALKGLPIFRHSWLFVDFFFVLSGFVIAASYGQRLASGFPVSRFMLLRLGRIYPLHLAVILVMAAQQVALLIAGAPRAFTGDYTLPTLATNLTLTQIFGIHDDLYWNTPSWSIAAEMWTYALAALGLAAFGTKIRWALVAAVVLIPLHLGIIDHHGLDRTYAYALERCVFGFSIGMLVYSARQKLGRLSPNVATPAEVVCIAALIVLVSLSQAGPMTLIYPLLFGGCVLIFSGDSGIVSRVLSVRAFRLLGALSYSIYMVHVLVLNRYIDVVGFVSRRLSIPAVGAADATPGAATALIGPWATPLSLLALVAVLCVSWVSYHFIEIPCRNWSRRLAKGIGKPRLA